MGKLENIVNKKDISSRSKIYRADFRVSYETPVNDFDYDTRHLNTSYFFEAKDNGDALNTAKNFLDRFNNETGCSLELNLPSGSKKLELMELIEVASRNLIDRPISNEDLKKRKSYGKPSISR